MGIGDQAGRIVDGRVSRVREHITNQEPLQHAADTRSDLEDAQGLPGGGWSQSRDQGLPDLTISRPFVYAPLGREVTRQAIGERDGQCASARR